MSRHLKLRHGVDLVRRDIGTRASYPLESNLLFVDQTVAPQFSDVVIDAHVIPRRQTDQPDVLGEGTLLDLFHKLG